jgi:hypothetical protein
MGGLIKPPDASALNPGEIKSATAWHIIQRHLQLTMKSLFPGLWQPRNGGASE